jgi:hypothetical protein
VFDSAVEPDPVAVVLNPDDCILTSLTGPDGVDYTLGGTDTTNIAVDPIFVQDVLMSLTGPDVVDQTYTLRTAQAPGEGGNTVQVSIKPIVPLGDYHLRADSPAIDEAAATAIFELVTDYDGEARPNPAAGDIGADEFYAPANLTLVTPNGGEVIPTGSTQTVFWQVPAGLPGTVTYRLQVSYDNGATWATIPGAEALATTTFDWQVPPKNENKRQSLIRVQAFDGATKRGQDVSDSTFEVEVVKILYPSDAIVQFTSGNRYDPPFGINWRLNDVKTEVKKATIQVSKNGGQTWEKADLSPDDLSPNPNPIKPPDLKEKTTFEHPWTPPDVGKGKTQAKVRVLLLDSAGIVIGKDQNDVSFTILPAQ